MNGRDDSRRVTPTEVERKASILVVDDEPAVLLTYRMILEDRGYQVTAVATSAEASSILDQGFDLLLCDLALERQDSGFDLTQQARRRDPEMA